MVRVHMFAFSDDRSKIREVEIPQEEYESTHSVQEVLELVFRYGQNDFQPQSIYSVSVGDVAELNGHYYMVMSYGFQEISKEEFDSLTPPTSNYAYQNSIKKASNPHKI